MQHMIGPMYPERAEVFIDDCAIKGPRSRYNENTIPENAQMRVCLGICLKCSRVASKSVGKWSHDFRSQDGFGDSTNAIAGRSSSRLSWYDLPSPSPPTSSHLRPHPPPLHLFCLHSASSTSALLILQCVLVQLV